MHGVEYPLLSTLNLFLCFLHSIIPLGVRKIGRRWGFALMVKPVDEHSRIELAGGTDGGIHLLFLYRFLLFSFLAGYGLIDCLE
jgi:hypothetical protein